jgi:hypothetical protein
MILLFVRAYLSLLTWERPIARRDFANVYRRVRDHAVTTVSPRADSCARASRAVNLACAAYFKEVQCLQRSATLVCLLRDLGSPAFLVLGAQHLPFSGHAWVEVNGEIVNDDKLTVLKFGILDRC